MPTPPIRVISFDMLYEYERTIAIMKRKQYSMDIQASKEKVWKVLWDEASYRDWTSAFAEGSHVKTDGWKEGSRVHFLDPKGLGMYSNIEMHVPNRLMAFEHLGEIKDGKEQPANDKWTGAKEIYTLEENGDHVNLKVDLDTADEYAEMMDTMFPKALARVKELSEN
jgi:hypothetical protein